MVLWASCSLWGWEERSPFVVAKITFHMHNMDVFPLKGSERPRNGLTNYDNLPSTMMSPRAYTLPRDYLRSESKAKDYIEKEK